MSRPTQTGRLARAAACAVVLLLASPLLGADATAPAPAEPGAGGPVDMAMENSLVAFERNDGQFPDDVRYALSGDHHVTLITDTDVITHVWPVPEASLPGAAPEPAADVNSSVVVTRFVDGAAPEAIVEEVQDHLTVRYFTGGDSSKWGFKPVRFQQLRAASVYDGIDVVHRVAEGAYEYDFVVAPGADPSQIRLAFDGADALRLDEDGNLWIDTPAGPIMQHAPVSFQEIDGQLEIVESAFSVLADGVVAFDLGDYDPTHLLTVDPKVTYAAPLFGPPGDMVSSGDGGLVFGATVGHSGYTSLNAYEPSRANYDLFVYKVNPDTRRYEFATYFGGEKAESGGVGAADADRILLYGRTTTKTASQFPLVNPIQAGHAGGDWDGMVAVLSGDGQELLFSTYIGGNSLDYLTDALFADDGSILFGGYGNSENLQTKNALRPYPYGSPRGPADEFYWGFVGHYDAYLGRISSTYDLVSHTYYGGDGQDVLTSMDLTPEGNLVVIGYTRSGNLGGNYQAQKSYSYDGHVAVFKGDLSGLLANTYVGGNGQHDYTGDEAVDVAANGDILVVLDTVSSDLPTPGTPFNERHGYYDSWIGRFNADLTELRFGMYVGGASDDWIEDIEEGPDGDIWFAGYSRSTDLPTLRAIQPLPSAAGPWYGDNGMFGRVTASGEMEVLSYFGRHGDYRLSRVLPTGTDTAYLHGAPHVETPDIWENLSGRAYGYLVHVEPCPGAVPTTSIRKMTGDLGNAPWYTSNVQVDYEVTSECLPAATYSIVDGGKPWYGTSVLVRRDGQHVLEYFSRDSSDGSLEETRSTVVSIDGTPPVTTPVLSGIEGENGWFQSGVNVALEATDATSGLAGTRYGVDGQALRPGSSTSVSGDGVHALEYTSTDVAGNQEPVRSADVRIDSVDPDGSITSPQAGGAYVLGQGVDLPGPLPRTILVGQKTVFVAADDATSGVALVELWVDGALAATSDAEPHAFPLDVDGMAPGEHTIRAVIRDAAGHAFVTPNMDLYTVPLPVDELTTPPAEVAALLNELALLLPDLQAILADVPPIEMP